MPVGSLIGEVAALATSICWAATGIFFTVSGRRVGSQAVNLIRLALALVIMLLLHQLALGTWLPWEAGPQRWGWLGLSGVIGLALADAALFEALVHIGPRLSTLLMALVPIFTTLLAWLLLGEALRPLDLVAVLVTVAGVAWVVLERGQGRPPAGVRDFRWGVLFGLGGALGQSLGLITSRLGLSDEFSVISANLIRTLAGSIALWSVSLAAGRGGRALRSVRADRGAALAIVAGTLFGPVTGVILSLVAIQRAPVGIASTLMSLAPIAILPLVRWVFRERISPRAMGGTALALAGVAFIFLW